MKTSKVLTKAAELLRKHGHCKYRLKDDQGSFCLMGAVNQASQGTHDYPYDFAHRYNKLIAYLDAAVPDSTDEYSTDDVTDRVCSVTTWNNAPERTEAEVLEALELAAPMAASDSE